MLFFRVGVHSLISEVHLRLHLALCVTEAINASE